VKPKLSSAMFDRVDEAMQSILVAARIPGGATAIVIKGETVHAKGYGFRDMAQRLPMSSATAYPIGSTTKALCATLVGLLVDERRLGWDIPVQTYLPWFRLRDPFASTQTTLRDLLSMRIGLPRHDWVWLDVPIALECIVERLRHLEPSAGFRERYQYNNLAYLTAGYITEFASAQRWADFAKQRILEPLGMTNTAFGPPEGNHVTLSYRENRERKLLLSPRINAESAGPAGGTIYSTVLDMARWMRFNLKDGHEIQKHISAETLMEIHSPNIATRSDPLSPTAHATYGMGWFIDIYKGRARLSHGGYLDDVQSEVSLHTEDDIGIVSFTNFGAPRVARLMNQRIFDLLMGFESPRAIENHLELYERKISLNQSRLAAVPRVSNTFPSHATEQYGGYYHHPAYGRIEVEAAAGELQLQRQSLSLTLEHWHYNSWVVRAPELVDLHGPHPFDCGSPVMFDVNAIGGIGAFTLRFEPSVAPIRFEKEACS
jgi:CubicO group peptidase (beta-lactamase class C family)